jgi:hypothetical protein
MNALTFKPVIMKTLVSAVNMHMLLYSSNDRRRKTGPHLQTSHSVSLVSFTAMQSNWM